ncbi:hypothetical protein D3C86_943930 [compost metagenome]
MAVLFNTTSFSKPFGTSLYIDGVEERGIPVLAPHNFTQPTNSSADLSFTVCNSKKCSDQFFVASKVSISRAKPQKSGYAFEPKPTTETLIFCCCSILFISVVNLLALEGASPNPWVEVKMIRCSAFG